MREFLFRGKEIRDDRWLIGCLTQSFEGGVERAMIRERGVGATWKIIDPATVGEYTSSKDGNKERIFEGDILTHSDGMYCVVFWDKGMTQWRVEYTEDFGTGLSYRLGLQIGGRGQAVVTSNIHDEPEKANNEY